jgi:transcriptional regulator with XRE-family HTH domain
VAAQALRPIRVAERLREAREARGLSHRQIADTTKLSVANVRAVETGQLASLPPGLYRRAIIRSIAREVGLHPEETVRGFLTECPDDLAEPCEVAVVQPARPGPSPWRRVAAVIGTLVPLLAGVAYFGRGALPGQPTLGLPTGGNRPPSAEAVAAGGLGPATRFDTRPVVMSITVSAACQLRVLADGAIVLGRMLDAGETIDVPFSDAIELSGDNAGAVQFSINGQAGRMLGAAGQPLSARITRDDYPAFLSQR